MSEYCKQKLLEPLTSAFGKQRQVDLYEIKASLDYTVSSKQAGATQRPVSKTKMKQMSTVVVEVANSQKKEWANIPVGDSYISLITDIRLSAQLCVP